MLRFNKFFKVAMTATLVFLLTFSLTTATFASLQYSSNLTNKMWVLYNSQNGLPTSEANTICQTRDGYIWIGSYAGLIRYDGVNFDNYSNDEYGIDCSGIRRLYEGEDGTLWIGTNENGVYGYKEGKFTHYENTDTRLNSIRSFVEDDEGTLYIGTATGLAVLDDGIVKPLDVENIGNQTIHTLDIDANGAIWGTAGAGYLFAVKNEKCYIGLVEEN